MAGTAALVAAQDNGRTPVVDVFPNNTGSALPGVTLVYAHTVSNIGTTSDEFALLLDSSQDWVVSTTYITQTIDPGNSVNFSVLVTIPLGEPVDVVDVTTVTVFAVNNPFVFDTATDTTTVLAPTNTPTTTPSPTGTSAATSTATTTATATPTATRTPTATPTATRDTTTYADIYEPNNSLQMATEITPDSGTMCDNTLWPVGDIDYYRFSAKAGSTYDIFTSDLSAGLDTYLQAYDTVGNVIASNDDYTASGRESKVTIFTGVTGYYYFSMVNLDPSDPTDKTYCVEVETQASTATPEPAPTLIPDECEPNGSFETACLIEAGVTYSLDFVPPIPPGPDNDFFRVWIKPGLLYTCETLSLSGVNDTNMILYDQNFNGLGGNDDKAIDDFGSLVSYFSTYTGWLYILVGPYAAPAYDQADLYTYNLVCESVAATPTPTATATPVASGGGGGGGFVPTATPRPTDTPTPLPTPGAIFVPPSPTPRPVLSFRPLPTPAPAAPVAPVINLTVTLYYDQNGNFMPELNEGIVNMPVALYDGITGELLAFGYTNDAGMAPFTNLQVNGPVRLVAPLLNFSQTVAPDVTAVQLRVAPQQLPVTIP